jgi:hypothetical protein
MTYLPQPTPFIQSSDTFTGIATGPTVDTTALPMRNWTVVVKGTPAPAYPHNLLLNFDGADGSSVIVDEGALVKTVTNIGPVINSNVSPKFGAGCGYFGASGTRYLTVPNDGDFYFPGDFTVDTWFRHTLAGGEFSFSTGTTDGWVVRYYGTLPLMSCYVNGVSNAWFFTVPPDIALNNWYHVALVRASGVVNLYLNGVSVISMSDANPIVATSRGDNALTIGRNPDWGTNAQTFSVDALRITKGLALWTTNFTPPTSPTLTIPPVYNIVLEGSLDGVIFSEIMSHTDALGLDEHLYSGTTLFPALYYRTKCTALSLGTYTSLTVNVLGQQ